MLVQLGCETVQMWKDRVPGRLQLLRGVGHMTYFLLRLGNPWITRVPRLLGLAFPKLENHFFVLGADTS
jgi:hypothetical protein